MAFESEYKLDSVAASRVAPEQIDATFKSSTIGKSIAIEWSRLRVSKMLLSYKT